MSKSEKKNLRYCDYYCFMSLKDFAAWVDADDDQEPADVLDRTATGEVLRLGPAVVRRLGFPALPSVAASDSGTTAYP